MSKINNPKFTIKNFRIFDKPETFELAPITILTGPNNSGKSSLVKSIDLINSSKINGRLRNFIDYNSKESKLYGDVNVLNDLSEDLSFSFEYTVKELSGKTFKSNLLFGNDGHLNGFSIFHKNKVLLSYIYHNNSLDYYDITFDLSLILKIFGLKSQLFSFIPEDDFHLNSNNQNQFETIENETIQYFRKTLKQDSTNPFESPFFNYTEEKIVEIQNVALPANRYSTIIEINKSLIKNIFNYYAFILEKNLVSSQFIANFDLCISKNGELLKNKLLTLLNSLDIELMKYEFHKINISGSVKNRNIDLNDNSILLNRLLKKYFQHTNPNDPYYFIPWLDSWLEKFDIGKGLIIKNFNREIANLEIVGFKNEKRDLSSCGTGVTQIITLLLIRLLDPSLIELINENVFETNELIFEENKWFYYLEEPECNLHPNWQSLLMELIIDLNKNIGIRFIIETHSEYMIRKLQNLVSKKIITSDEIKIYYFNSDKNVTKDEKKVKEMIIREDGVMSTSFGTGFYDEALKLTIDLLKIENYN